jgi:predicted metalloprotease with PDZ domain
MPEFERLFKNVGIHLKLDESNVSFGAEVRYQKITDNPRMGSTAYLAGFQKGDKILKVGAFDLNEMVPLDMVLNKYNVGDKVKMTFQRYDKIKEVEVTLTSQIMYYLSLMEKDATSNEMIQNRKLWLHAKQ